MILGKVLIFLSYPAVIDWIVSLLSFYKGGFGIK